MFISKLWIESWPTGKFYFKETKSQHGGRGAREEQVKSNKNGEKENVWLPHEYRSGYL